MSVVFIKRGVQGLLFLLCTVWAVQGHALPAPNYRALLVGVSSYPTLVDDLQLKGPKNDVLRMRALLTARGFSKGSIRVLADGVDGAALPTRAAILGALRQLADTAKPDDYILILVGGHGSQMPVPDGHPQADAESDGLFEIFLPRDVKGWRNRGSQGSGMIENAILDAEFREHIDRMSAAGAFVWAIFDTCHSATMVRSGGRAVPGSEMRLRQVSPAALGVPYGAVDRARAQARQRAKLPGTSSLPRPQSPLSRSGAPGNAVYFYAAQATEHCGRCSACLDICPTQAFVGPYVLDARRCISYLTIEHKGPVDLDLRALMGNRIYGCDDCLAVCPWNKFAQSARDIGYTARVGAPELAELVALDDASFRARFAGSPIKRIGRDRFVRNCLYAAGNSGNGALTTPVSALTDDPDPVVAEAAAWALARLTSNP